MAEDLYWRAAEQVVQERLFPARILEGNDVNEDNKKKIDLILLGDTPALLNKFVT